VRQRPRARAARRPGADAAALRRAALPLRRLRLPRFREALCLSGKYDLEDWFDGEAPPLDFHYVSPLHFLPFLDDADHLALLRRRFVRLVCGRGRAERPEYAFRVAQVLGGQGVPNRVDVRGADWHHDWQSWREALPAYLGPLAPARPVLAEL
jgi:esterase/lipase superfamily enzyme